MIKLLSPFFISYDDLDFIDLVRKLYLQGKISDKVSEFLMEIYIHE